MSEEKSKFGFWVELLLAVFALSLLVIFVININKQHDKEANLKPCTHWIYKTKIRARIEYSVLCGTDLILKSNGEYENLPWWLEEQKQEINKQFDTLQTRINKAVLQRRH